MTPLVAISDDFLEAYAQIPRQQQKKVRAFMEKFKADPTSNAIHYEKIHEVKDDRVRTVRIDQKYRAVVLHPSDGSVYVLVWVDNHDEAMDWAKSRTFAINPATGALQMFNASAAVKVINEKTRSTGQPGLLAGHDDGTLLSFGLPELLLPAVRAITTLSDLDKLAKHLPVEAAEALHWLAEGIPPEEVREAVSAAASASVDTGDFAAALKHPDSKRRFVTIQSDAELITILDAPLEKWRVFLHPSQERLVGKPFNGPVRVLGGPGTGKTVVAMHRARHLARTLCENSSERIRRRRGRHRRPKQLRVFAHQSGQRDAPTATARRPRDPEYPGSTRETSGTAVTKGARHATQTTLTCPITTWSRLKWYWRYPI